MDWLIGMQTAKVAFGDHKRVGVPDSGNRIKAEYKTPPGLGTILSPFM